MEEIKSKSKAYLQTKLFFEVNKDFLRQNTAYQNYFYLYYNYQEKSTFKNYKEITISHIVNPQSLRKIITSE